MIFLKAPRDRVGQFFELKIINYLSTFINFISGKHRDGRQGEDGRERQYSYQTAQEHPALLKIFFSNGS